jgi:sugar lactone lactonase YvrE
MKASAEAAGSTKASRDAGLLFALMGRPAGIWSVRPDGSELKKVIGDCGTPDGIAVDLARGHIYWTNTGEEYGANDGFIERIDLDGTNRVIVIPKGSTFTPKQSVFDATEDLLYWSDREGMRVMRAGWTEAISRS